MYSITLSNLRARSRPFLANSLPPSIANAVSKFATEGLVQILSEELENTSCIRVNAINPGPVRTKMRAEAYPAEDPKTVPNPKDIMNAYLFLMGEDSLNISGKSIEAQ